MPQSVPTLPPVDLEPSAVAESPSVSAVGEQDLAPALKQLVGERDESFRGSFGRFAEAYRREQPDLPESDYQQVEQLFYELIDTLDLTLVSQLFREFKTHRTSNWASLLAGAWRILGGADLEWHLVPARTCIELFWQAAEVGQNPAIWSQVGSQAESELDTASDNKRAPLNHNLTRLRRLRQLLGQAHELITQTQQAQASGLPAAWAGYEFPPSVSRETLSQLNDLDQERTQWLQAMFREPALIGQVSVESLIGLAVSHMEFGTIRCANLPLVHMRRLLDHEFPTPEAAILGAMQTWDVPQTRTLSPNGFHLYAYNYIHYPTGEYYSLLQKVRSGIIYASQEVQLFPVRTRDDLDFKLTYFSQDLPTTNLLNELVKRTDIVLVRDYLMRFYRCVDTAGFANWHEDLAWIQDARELTDQELHDILTSITTLDQARSLGELVRGLRRRDQKLTLKTFAQLESCVRQQSN